MKRAPINKCSLTIGDEEHELDARQLALLNQWIVGVIDRIDEFQCRAGRKALTEMEKARGEVYAGLGGGNLTFTITPTNIGTVFKISESITGESIDLAGNNW